MFTATTKKIIFDFIILKVCITSVFGSEVNDMTCDKRDVDVGIEESQECAKGSKHKTTVAPKDRHKIIETAVSNNLLTERVPNDPCATVNKSFIYRFRTCICKQTNPFKINCECGDFVVSQVFGCVNFLEFLNLICNSKEKKMKIPQFEKDFDIIIDVFGNTKHTSNDISNITAPVLSSDTKKGLKKFKMQFTMNSFITSIKNATQLFKEKDEKIKEEVIKNNLKRRKEHNGGKIIMILLSKENYFHNFVLFHGQSIDKIKNDFMSSKNILKGVINTPQGTPDPTTFRITDEEFELIWEKVQVVFCENITTYEEVEFKKNFTCEVLCLPFECTLFSEKSVFQNLLMMLKQHVPCVEPGLRA